MTSFVLVLLAAYLIGAIPTGLLLTRLTGGGDIRQTGSGNIGATNVYRTGGRKLGVLTLIGDALKGLLPVLLAMEQGGIKIDRSFLGELEQSFAVEGDDVSRDVDEFMTQLRELGLVE